SKLYYSNWVISFCFRSLGRFQQFFRCDPEPLNGGGDCGPSVGKKLLPFGLEQQIARADIDEHAEAAPGLDQLLADQLLIGLENGEGIYPIFRRDIAHRWQHIAFVENAVENHSDDTIPQLSINRLTVVPFTVHPVFRRTHWRAVASGPWLFGVGGSSGVIHNYNTNALASTFLRFFWPAVPASATTPEAFAGEA